jgi:uncharacterized repeat protein (TIGR03803 family)
MSTRIRNRLGIALGFALAAVIGAGAVSTAKAGTESVKYDFCTLTSCADGNLAEYSLLRQGNKYYGTTADGGANNGGTVFRYNANTSNYTVLYSFCATMSGTTCTDGGGPTGPLIMDVNGNLYGTTQAGGTNNGGTVFELVKPATGSTWTLTTLYDFCASKSGTLCLDGQRPVVGVSYVGNGTSMYDGTSILYGTTYNGGNDSNSSTGWGTAFEIEPPVSGTLWQEKVIHSFCASCIISGSSFPNTGCSDGEFPNWAPLMDGSGNLYGTAFEGGNSSDDGNVWDYNTSTSTFSSVYDFCPAGGSCTDGANPGAGLIFDGSGNLWSVTNSGGNATNNGVIFEVVP